MAYVELRAAADLAPIANPSRESDGLGPDEWSVVELARKDGIRSVHPDRLSLRLVRILFGIRPAQPLANERLEALRRFAVVAWHRTNVGASWVRQFLAAGFTRADARRVLDYIDRQRNLHSWPRGLA